MKNSKLISLLNTFSSTDWRRFKEFLTSPFFNKNKELLTLYNYLRSVAPEFEEQKVLKTVVFKKVHPKKTFNSKVLEDLIYHLLKHAENYLKISRLEKEETTGNLLILEELMVRDLEKHYRIYSKKAHQFLAQKQHRDSQYYLFQYQLSEIVKRNFLAQNQRKYNPILEESLAHLDQFYFFNKLKSSCELLDWKNIIAVNVDLHFIEEVVSHLSLKKEDLNPIQKIYLTIYQLLTKETAEEDFIRLRSLLNQHQSHISTQEKNYLYLSAINYCGTQMQKNNNVLYYVNQCLELYLEGVEQKFLYSNGYLTPWTFKNIVKLGFNLKKFDWTADFIQQYYTHLEEGYQEDAFHYNMADLNYRKKAYQEALSHLMQVQYSDIFYNLGSKAMLIKIYHETAEEEALLSMLASFTIYLKRNKKIANSFRLTYLNFTSLVNKLIKAKPHKIAAILEEIKTIQPLTDRRWLLALANSKKKSTIV